jgi:hypothetical protein
MENMVGALLARLTKKDNILTLFAEQGETKKY